MPIPQGRFVWHDLATTDVEGAKNFYSQIAPWTIKPWDQDENYTLVEAEGAPLGGIMALPTPSAQSNGAHANWTPSVYVYDVDACARQAEKLGGRIVMQPREIPNVGCWAMIADPDGASIAIFEPSSGDPPGHDGPPRVSEFSWHELSSNDWKKSWEFYRQLFHWEKIEEHDMGALGTYFIFGLKGQAMGGMFTRTPDMPAPNWTSYLEVDSVKSAVPKVKQLGGRVMREPHQVPGGSWITLCSDPQGATFALTSARE